MSAWTCEKCGWSGRITQKSGHKAFQCPEQGNLKKALAAPQYLPCLCGCGERIPQVKGRKKAHFVDRDHYERWRAPQRSAEAQRAAAVPEQARARREAEEMAPVVAKEEAAAREATGLRLVLGEQSFQLWAKCLGFKAGDSVEEAA